MATYGPTAVEAFSSGYQAMEKVTEDIASSDILKQAYADTDAATMTPEQKQSSLSKASVLAGQRGLNSLSYSFNKQAGELAKDNLTSQISSLKLKTGQIEYASQLAQSAKDDSDLQMAVDAAGIPTQEKMLYMRIIKDPAVPFEKKKEALVKAGMSAKENADAAYKTLIGEARLEDAKTRAADELRKEKKDANRQAGGGDDKALNKELADLDKGEAAALARAETNPYVTDKEAAKANIRKEYEAKRQAAKQRRDKTGGKEPTKKSEFVEGQIYEDANGNRAKYSQGRWIPVK
jgi:hypothetical protein